MLPKLWQTTAKVWPTLVIVGGILLNIDKLRQVLAKFGQHRQHVRQMWLGHRRPILVECDPKFGSQSICSTNFDNNWATVLQLSDNIGNRRDRQGDLFRACGERLVINFGKTDSLPAVTDLSEAAGTTPSACRFLD